jgi:hypothetical protein
MPLRPIYLNTAIHLGQFVFWDEGNYNYLDCYSHRDTGPETVFHFYHTMSERRLERVNFFTNHADEDYYSGHIVLDAQKLQAVQTWQ